MQFFAKIYENGAERLLAVCDKELVGKKLKHNGVNLLVREEFYGTDEWSKEEIIAEIKRCTSVNAFGKLICDILIENKIIHPSTVLWIENGDAQVGHVILVR